MAMVIESGTHGRAAIEKAEYMKACLFGADPGTGNLGVSALCQSALAALFRYCPDAQVTVFDHGRGRRRGLIQLEHGDRAYTLQGAVHSRRYYRTENLRLMRLCAQWRLPFPAGVRAIRDADVVLDVSGGDSFTDLYGMARFQAIVLPKLVTLALDRPLVLLPQTYGPFRQRETRAVAQHVVRAAHLAWARDVPSYDRLRELLGDAFDPARHRCGVDMAFALPSVRPTFNGLDKLDRWFNDDRPLVGVNISGLLANSPRSAGRYNFRADYREVVYQFVRRLLVETDCRVLLVPHVITPMNHYESDHKASHDLVQRLKTELTLEGRVVVVAGPESAGEIKWVIGKLDWFCGTRMHSTIAGLSSGVPTAAISYSDKTLGVFQSCGQGESVVDPRVLGTEEVVEQLWTLWQQREEVQRQLATRLEAVRARAEGQMQEIMAACEGTAVTMSPECQA